MTTDKKWKRYEKLVAQVQALLSPDAKVTHDDKILGKKSGTLRQIDVSVRKNVGQFDLLIAIECKDTSKPADIKDVEESIGLFQDVGAHKGAIVSAAGFTESAKSRGSRAGLELYRLIDAEDHDWKAIVSMPVLCDFRGIKSYNFTFSSGPGPLVIPPIDPRYIVLFDENKQRLGTTMELLFNRWNHLEPPVEPGEVRDLKLGEGMTYLLYNDTYYEVIVKSDIIVEQKLYFGNLPIEEIKGFQDEIRGGIITQSFTTAALDVVEVERTWQKIESRDSLAVNPLLILTARDVYGESAVEGG